LCGFGEIPPLAVLVESSWFAVVVFNCGHIINNLTLIGFRNLQFYDSCGFGEILPPAVKFHRQKSSLTFLSPILHSITDIWQCA
jgi:hypothetical protein